MNIDNANAKEKILQAALELLSSEEGSGGLTTRKIAKKANVNLALINYYYQSKENLLSLAAGCKMGEIISGVLENGSIGTDAVDKLKKLLITTADFSFRHSEIYKIAVAGELKEGCKNSCSMVIPILKEIFRDKDETELNIIALQLMLPFHFVVLHPEEYGKLLKTDFFDERQRNGMINQMADNLLMKALGLK